MSRITNGWESVQVKRGDVTVEDPLNELRPYLPEDLARWADRETTLLGVEYASADDETLAARMRELGPPWQEFDGHHLEDDWEGYELPAEEAFEVAKAKLRVHDLEPDPDSILHAQRWRELFGEVDSRRSAFHLAEQNYDFHSPGPFLWPEDKRWEAVEWAAAARELALRQQVEIRRELGQAALQEPDPSMPIREIGPGADVADLQLEKEYEQAYMGPPTPQDRDRVNPTLTVDRLGGLLSDAQAQQLSRRIATIANWVQGQPAGWVRQRHRELGVADDSLDRSTAREVSRLENVLTKKTEQRDAARTEELEFANSDGDRAAVARESAASFEDRMETASVRLSALAEREGHPARVATSFDVALAAAYHDELVIRQHVWIAREVDKAVLEPSAELQERIGPRPGWRASEQTRQVWRDTAHELEWGRLERMSAEQEGLAPPEPPNAAEERRLQAQIDFVREQQGMPPEQQLAAEREMAAIGR